MSQLDDYQRKLLADRVVAIFAPVDDEAAERAIGQLLYLEEIDAGREITLSLSSPGGSITAGLSILQTIANLAPPLRTVCLDRCGGVATLLLAAGARGSRTARQGARISLDKLAARESGVADLPLEQLRRKLVALASALSGQPPERIAQDLELELELTAEGARRYGLIDEVFVKPAE
jgi:ATP-dependent Clp protease protease subunit